jgi:hypothetical protein
MPLKCTRCRQRLPPPAPAVRLHKAADAEIAKQRGHRYSDQKTPLPAMIRSRLIQRRPHLPGSGSSEQRKNPEENPSQLQPQLPRQLHKRPPHRLTEAPAALFEPFPRLSNLCCRPRSLRSQPNSGGLCFTRSRRFSWSRSRRLNGTRSLLLLRNRRRIRRSRCIRCRDQRLRCRTSPDTKRTTKSSRIHTSKCSRSRHASESLDRRSRNVVTHRRIQRCKTDRSSEESESEHEEGSQRHEKYSLDGRWNLRSCSRLPGLVSQSHAVRRTARASSKGCLGRPSHCRRNQLSPIVL